MRRSPEGTPRKRIRKSTTDGLITTRSRNFVCTYPGCTKTYATKSHLRAHVCIHTGEKRFVCTYPFPSRVLKDATFNSMESICGERFTRSDELTRHRRWHEDSRPFICSFCSRAFRRSDHRQVHERRHERERQSLKTTEIEGASPTVVPREAPEHVPASKTGKDPTERHSLKRLRNPPTSRKTSVPPRTYICTYPGCKKEFTKNSYLLAHSYIHTGYKPFVCTYPIFSEGGDDSSESTRNICGKRFLHSGDLSRHRRGHENIRPFVCSVCSQAFSRADHLRFHVRRHEAQRQVVSTVTETQSDCTTNNGAEEKHCIEENKEEIMETKSVTKSTPEPANSNSPVSHSTPSDEIASPLACILVTGTFACLLPVSLLTTSLLSQNLLSLNPSAQLFTHPLFTSPPAPPPKTEISTQTTTNPLPATSSDCGVN